MRTQLKPISVLLIALFGMIHTSHAQKTIYDYYLDEVRVAFRSMINNAVEVKKKTKCEVSQLMGDAVLPANKHVRPIMQLSGVFRIPNREVERNIDPGIFPGKMDAALYAIGTQKTFKKWVKYLTKKDVSDLTKREQKEFKIYYDYLRKLQKWSTGFQVKTLEARNCKMKATYSARVSKYSYPKIYWDIKTTVTIVCDCKKEGVKFKSAVYEYTANTVGKINSGKKYSWSFGTKANNPKLTLKSYKCCPKVEEKDKRSGYLLPETPQQYVGFGLGLAFENDFQETTFCAGAEYMIRVAQPGNDHLYVGAAATYQTSSFSDFNRNGFQIGPKIQYNTPVSATGETQWTNGIKGFYSFGNDDGPGFETSYNGFEVCLYTGFNIPLSDNLAIGIDIPVLNYENLTFDNNLVTGTEGDNGESFPSGAGDTFKVDGFSLFINKAPAYVSLRIGLD